MIIHFLREMNARIVGPEGHKLMVLQTVFLYLCKKVFLVLLIFQTLQVMLLLLTAKIRLTD